MRNPGPTIAVALALVACSSDDSTSATPIAPVVVDDALACVGSPESRGDALRAAIEGAEHGATVLLGECEYLVGARLLDAYDGRQDTLYNSGIRIENVNGLTIRGSGAGRTVVRFARPVYVGFQILSNTTNLTIADLTVAGSITRPLCEENPELAVCYGGRMSDIPNTHGIVSTARSQGIRNIHLTRLEVRDLATGISVGTWGGAYCDYADVVIEGNHVHDMHGTYGGSGYGIHVGCATGVTIRDNLIERTGRHAIYVARSPEVNPRRTLIIRNEIVDHAHGEMMDRRVAAIAIARSDNVAAVDNTIIRSHAYGISVEFDPDTGFDCTRCVVIGNEFVGTGEVEDIWITSRSPAWLWGNRGGLAMPPTVRDESGMARDAAEPGRYWTGTQWVTSMTDPETGRDLVYVMRDDLLHAVPVDESEAPDVGWRALGVTEAPWPDFVDMVAGGGRVFVRREGALHVVTPRSSDGAWPKAHLGGWPGRGEMAYIGGQLYMAIDGTLQQVDASTGSSTLLNAALGEVLSLSVAGASAYFRVGGIVYALEVGAFGSQPRVVD